MDPKPKPCLAALLALALATAPAAAQPVPAQFVNGHVWLTPRVDGRELRLFTDTGGGFNAISRDVASTMGLAMETVEADGQDMTLTAFPVFDADARLPPAPTYFMQGRLAVVEPAAFPFATDGFLGGRWFADGIWDFDYPAGTLHRLAAFEPGPGMHGVNLGFQVGADGQRSMHFPSMPLNVAGEELHVLLDTGATATLGEDAAAAFGLPTGTPIGTSFIEREVFDRWTAANPGWRVLERGDALRGQSFRMIEVPELVIGGLAIGPVWFTERPPGAFQNYMASMMDRPTWGALGGSAFRHARMVVDYPAAKAWFVAPEPASP